MQLKPAMKKHALSCTLLALAGSALAQEVGQVISRTPVYQQVASPRQTCQQVIAPSASTGGGAVLGAVVGGLIGNALGGGDSRGISTMAGVLGGSVIGDRIETDQNNRPVTTCTTQNVMENRLVGYSVVYEYAGKQYTVQLPQDPGPTIALQVTPMGSPASVAPPAPATVVTQPPVIYSPPPVVYAPAAPVYYRPWPVNTSVHLGWGWHGGGHHRHWR